ncbi:MAG: alpha/beta hydrolase [Parasphingorhabdus sp.]|uniref:alpha/beta fold hydrolase n=2 Tax=Parasphingorhabdus sp. TaxID=2709688 RepID=UPI00326780A8
MNFPIQQVFQSSQGEICYFEWGRANEGPSILLLHATGFHARCWDKVVAAFPEDTHVIAVDQLGHGRSAKPVITDWTMVAAATAELVESLGVKFAASAGHSMGGHCLVQVVDRLPDLFERLVLVDPVIMGREVYQNPPDYSATNEMVAKRRNSWTGPDAMVDRFQDRHPYKLWDPDVLRDYCEYGLLPDGEGGYILACPPQTEASVYATSASVDPWPMIDRIKQSVTILRAPQIERSGAFDFAGSPTPAGLADSFSDGTDVYLPDLTHFMAMQDPKHIGQLIVGV